PRDSPFRAQAAVRHVLQEAQGDGHVGYPEDLALELATALTQIAPDGIRDAVEQLRITDEIVRDSVAKASGGFQEPNPPAPFPRREGGGNCSPSPLGGGGWGEGSSEPLLYLKPLFLAELGVARQIRALAR